MMRRFESGKGSFGGMMIEATLLVDMMAKYINENGMRYVKSLIDGKEPEYESGENDGK